MPRRVGSASAWKARSSRANSLSMCLTNVDAQSACKRNFSICLTLLRAARAAYRARHDGPAHQFHPHRRLRQPGDPADRAAGARGRGLLRDRAVQPRRRGVRAAAAQGHHPLRRAVVGDVGRQPARAAAFLRQPACRCSPSATASRRWRQQLGGRVAPSDSREFGRAFIEIVGESALFDGLWKSGETHQVWMSHGDRVETLARGLRASSRVRRRALCGRDRRGRGASTA